jgi:hypothetical protein
MTPVAPAADGAVVLVKITPWGEESGVVTVLTEWDWDEDMAVLNAAADLVVLAGLADGKEGAVVTAAGTVVTAAGTVVTAALDDVAPASTLDCDEGRLTRDPNRSWSLAEAGSKERPSDEALPKPPKPLDEGLMTFSSEKLGESSWNTKHK